MNLEANTTSPSSPTIIGRCYCGRRAVIVVGADVAGGPIRAAYCLRHLDDAIDAVRRIRDELEEGRR